MKPITINIQAVIPFLEPEQPHIVLVVINQIVVYRGVCPVDLKSLARMIMNGIAVDLVPRRLVQILIPTIESNTWFE